MDVYTCHALSVGIIPNGGVELQRATLQVAAILTAVLMALCDRAHR